MTEVTYYFNAKGTDVWSAAGYIIDNILTNYAYSDSDGDIQVVNGNTCPGTDLGNMTKVELRVYGYGDENDRIDIIPVFGGSSDGDTHQTTPGVSAGWGIYHDITNDTNHPSPWAWSDVQALDCKVIKEDVAKGNVMYCAKVDLRVSYSEGTPRSHGFIF